MTRRPRTLAAGEALYSNVNRTDTVMMTGTGTPFSSVGR